MSNPKFHAQAKHFVKKVIRVRKAIIRKGANRVTQASYIIERIEKQFKTWPYSTDFTMASFITRYHNELCTLIPGGECKAGATLLKELESFNAMSQQIICKR